ncbi:MAG TPA: hypothetical protein VGJ54_18420 [Streptosporangiaceae bacterium]
MTRRLVAGYFLSLLSHEVRRKAVWANFPLALLFLLAWAGHPLRMTLRHPHTVPDRAAAHAYLAAKVAFSSPTAR